MDIEHHCGVLENSGEGEWSWLSNKVNILNAALKMDQNRK